MKKGEILHLFNAFQVGGAERQHMEHVRCLDPNFRQACWAPCSGPIEGELEELGIPCTAGGPEEVMKLLARVNFDCIVIRTNWYFDELQDILGSYPAPILFIKDYLRWYQGNNQYLDQDYDARIFRLANQVFFAGPSLRQGFHDMGLTGKGEAMLFNGIDLSAMPMEVRSPPQSPIKIGMLANIVPHKNQLKVITLLKSKLKGHCFKLILGGDIQDEEYGRKVMDAAQGLDVEICGYVSDPVSFFTKVDILLNASSLEGWPVSIMEAMGCGVPVIAPAVGDIPELLDHGRAGLLFEPGDISGLPTMLEHICKPKTYRIFSANGIRQVKRFDIKNMARQLEEAIECLVANRLPCPSTVDQNADQ